MEQSLIDILKQLQNRPLETNKGQNIKYIESLHQMDTQLTFTIILSEDDLVVKSQTPSIFLSENSKLKKKIIEYLINMIQKVSSISFRYYNEDIMDDKQMKNYASKNILENIIYLSKQIYQFILCYFKEGLAQKIIREINKFILNEIQVVISQLVSKYPIVPPTGVSSELIDTIKSIDSRKDYKLDFLMINFDQNYFAEKQLPNIKKNIMKTINKMIVISFQKIEKDKIQTYNDQFQKFNKNLLWLATQKQITKKVIQRQKDKLCQFLQNKSKQQSLSDILDYKLRVQKLKDLYENKKILLGVKLSKSVVQFEKKEIQNEDLRIQNSAILRVIVKWIEDLQDIFSNSRNFILQNAYQFKNHQNKPITLNINQKRILHNLLTKKWSQIQQTFREQKNQYNQLVSIILQDKNVDAPEYLFEKSLSFSSYINQFFIKKTIQRLIRLIKDLQQITNKAGELQKQSKNIRPTESQEYAQQLNQQVDYHAGSLKEVSLVVNRLGDQMRGTFNCKQYQFINVLNLMYQLDRHCREKGSKFFQLVRIKNKIKQENNNALINYMFYGKIQCELQLFLDSSSSVKEKEKIKKNNQMSHFLYQLTRGQYGVLAQLTTIVNQNDPINVRNKSSSLFFKKYAQQEDKLYQIIPFDKDKLRSSQIERQIENKQIWRCYNLYCSQFNIYGKCNFVEDQDRLFCLRCFQIKNSGKQNINNIYILKRLKSLESWISNLLSNPNIIQQYRFNQQISKQYCQIILIVQPTEKKIITEFFIIFYSQINSSLVIKSLQSTKGPNKIDKKKYQSELKQNQFYFKITNKIYFKKYLTQYNKGKLPIKIAKILEDDFFENSSLRQDYEKKVNQQKFKQQLQKLQSLTKEIEIQSKQLRQKKQKQQEQYHHQALRMKILRKYLKNQIINNFIYESELQLNEKFLKENLINSNPNIILSYRNQIGDKLEKQLSENKQTQVHTFQSQSTNFRIQHLQQIKKFENLKILNLNDNSIQGIVTIEFKFLQKLYLNKNKINSIKITKSPNLKEIQIGSNISLANFEYSNSLGELQKLNLENNSIAQLKLLALSKLLVLNVSGNRIKSLNIQDSNLLKKLSCNKSSRAQKNIIEIQIKLHQQVQLEELFLFRYSTNNIKKQYCIKLKNCALSFWSNSFDFLAQLQNLKQGYFHLNNQSKESLKIFEGQIEWISNKKIQKIQLFLQDAVQKNGIKFNLSKFESLKFFRLLKRQKQNIQNQIVELSLPQSTETLILSRINYDGKTEAKCNLQLPNFPNKLEQIYLNNASMKYNVKLNQCKRFQLNNSHLINQQNGQIIVRQFTQLELLSLTRSQVQKNQQVNDQLQNQTNLDPTSIVVESCKNLRYVNLAGKSTNIKTLKLDLNQAKQLKTLVLAYKNIQNIDIKVPKQLQKLDIKSSQSIQNIKSIPQSYEFGDVLVSDKTSQKLINCFFKKSSINKLYYKIYNDNFTFNQQYICKSINFIQFQKINTVNDPIFQNLTIKLNNDVKKNNTFSLVNKISKKSGNSFYARNQISKGGLQQSINELSNQQTNAYTIVFLPKNIRKIKIIVYHINNLVIVQPKNLAQSQKKTQVYLFNVMEEILKFIKQSFNTNKVNLDNFNQQSHKRFLKEQQKCDLKSTLKNKMINLIKEVENLNQQSETKMQQQVSNAIQFHDIWVSKQISSHLQSTNLEDINQINQLKDKINQIIDYRIAIVSTRITYFSFQNITHKLSKT